MKGKDRGGCKMPLHVVSMASIEVAVRHLQPFDGMKERGLEEGM
jgi:hypothetical protein